VRVRSKALCGCPLAFAARPSCAARVVHIGSGSLLDLRASSTLRALDPPPPPPPRRHSLLEELVCRPQSGAGGRSQALSPCQSLSLRLFGLAKRQLARAAVLRRRAAQLARLLSRRPPLGANARPGSCPPSPPSLSSHSPASHDAAPRDCSPRTGELGVRPHERPGRLVLLVVGGERPPGRLDLAPALRLLHRPELECVTLSCAPSLPPGAR